MDVIITHINADFDAFASMVAAKKLYPDAVVAFPGSQEKNLRDFFMESTLYILSIERAKDIDLEKIDRLIVVDTRQRSRIGRFAALADNPKVKIHVYDHHPDSDDDIKGHFEIVRPVGATVTILVNEIRSRDMQVNAEEATIIALGLHEDTGSFTFPSTTSEDFAAAAWLMDCGANLNVISNMLTSEWSTAQIEMLHQLIEGSELVNIGGLEIMVATAGAEEYIGDLAVLVHRYKEMENLSVIFAIVRMEDRIHLIARSSIEEVNAGEISAEFGGGGHAYAASATIREMSLFEAKDRLIALLHARVHPKRKAGQIMSRPVYTIGPDKTISQAAEYLSRYQVSSLPVVRNGSILGIVHRNAVERALHHGLRNEPVYEYMNPGIMFVTPEEPIERVLRMTVDARLRLVPVVEDGRIVGVISRSDLLEHLKLPRESDSVGPEEFQGSRSKNKSVKRLMEERFPAHVMQILRKAGEIATAEGEDVYLVGGAVRDLLLRNHNLDIDLVVEGEGISFALQLASQFPGCRVRCHEKFGTAVVLFSDGFKIDVVSARHEYYARPGALPTVEMSSIKRDLYRRDFTINTLAVSLNAHSMGRLIDFFGGGRDIKEKVIRVLHNLAFVEDPTRILRALRFASRFGFSVGKHTLNLIKAAIKMKIFDRVEGKRLLNELIHILDEKNPIAPLTLMSSYGVFQALHPALVFTNKLRDLLEAVTAVLSWWKFLFLKDKLDTWVVLFSALTDPLTDEDFYDVMRRFSMTPSQAQEMLKQRVEARQALAALAHKAGTPSEIIASLERLSLATLLFMMSKTTREQSRMAISEYITNLRHVKPVLTGKDLISMGYKPGPLFNSILRALRDAKLDRKVVTSEDERAFVRENFGMEEDSLPFAQ